MACLNNAFNDTDSEPRSAEAILSQVNKCAPVDLAYDAYDEDTDPALPPVVILHALLVSRKSWENLARKISYATKRKVYTLDVRNHGDSPHAEDMDFVTMAADLLHFLRNHDINKAILIGHSLGGRTVMLLALFMPNIVEKLVVIDISPFKTPPFVVTGMKSYLEAMKKSSKYLPTTLPIKEAYKLVDRDLSESLPKPKLRRWLLENLRETMNGVDWCVNVDTLDKHLTKFTKLPVISSTFNGTCLFICGGRSQFIQKEDQPAVHHLFPQAKFVYIPGAGHAVHEDKPNDFLEALLKHM